MLRLYAAKNNCCACFIASLLGIYTLDQNKYCGHFYLLKGINAKNQTRKKRHPICFWGEHIFFMEIKALVKFREQYAEYRIVLESEGIYTAILERYEGSVHNLPPPKLTMTKGVRHWIGSTEEQPLLDELGEVIDLNVNAGTTIQLDKNADAVQEEG
jgi:hypothetical protein